MESFTNVSVGDVIIDARNIVKHYGHVEALRGADLQITAGQVTALVGDNGAGKSTLANIICGAIPKTSGELTCLGERIEIQSITHAQELGIQVIYQDLALAPELSVPENIFLGKELIKRGLLSPLHILDKAEMRKRSEQYLQKLGIGLKSTAVPVKNLSGGERQSLAVAKAVAWAKTTLIMDEPTAALGARQSALVYRAMRSAADQMLGVLVISHDIPKMVEKADRIAVMRHGVVIANLNTEETSVQEVLSLMLTGQY